MTAQDVSCTAFTWQFLGGPWFEPGSWECGIILSLAGPVPNQDLPIYIGPVLQVVNGIPTGNYTTPTTPAVLSAAFTSPQVTVTPAGSASVLTIAGVTYTTSISVGKAATNGYPTNGTAVLNLNGTSTITGSVTIGDGDRGELNVNGTASIGSFLSLATSNGAAAVVNIAPGASLQVAGNVFAGSGAVTVNNGGHVFTTGQWTLGGSENKQWTNLAGSSLTVSGAFVPPPLFTNRSLVTFAGSNPSSSDILQLTGQVTLAGGGEVVLVNGQSQITSASGGGLVNQDNTIRGSGYLYTPITNQSRIRAEGGRLTFGAPVDNSAGIVEVASNGILHAGNDLRGGTLAVTAGGRVVDGSTLRNITSTGAITLEGFVGIFERLTNTGVITIAGSPLSVAELRLLGAPTSVTLTGGGEVVLVNGQSQIANQSGGGLVNQDNTIRGSGYLNTPITNQSRIRAEGGLLVASSSIDGSGQIEIGASSEFRMSGTLKTHGITLDPAGTFAFQGSRLEFAQFNGDLLHTWGTLAPALSTITGDYAASQSARVEIALNAQTGSLSRLVVGGDVSLSSTPLVISVPPGATVPSGRQFEILDVGGTRTGQFNGLAEGALVGTFGVKVFITYQGGDGNDIALFSEGQPFTDDPVVAGASTIQAVHVTELRARIDALRARFGVSPFPWTNGSLVSVVVNRLHVEELRSALVAAYAAAKRNPPSFTEPTLTPQASVVRAIHIQELRAAVLALELE